MVKLHADSCCWRICIFVIVFSISAQATTNPNHASVLTLLKLTFFPSPALDSWSGDDPCGDNWQGILCVQSEVTFISLPNLGLEGTLAPQISQINTLIAIDFSGNPGITGSIPSNFTTLKNLVSLRLQNCRLSGFIPNDIGELQSLQYMYLGGNQLTGKIPPSIGNLTQLNALDVSNNKLSGDLPPTIYQLVNLKQLYLQNNEFNGTLSSNFSNFINLQNISISNCNFYGSLPSFSGMQNLLELNLSYNDFDGEFPPEIGRDINELATIDVSNTTLSGFLNFITKLTNLQVFYADYCSFDGALPDLNVLKNLTVFSVLRNNITDFSTPLNSFATTIDIELYGNPVCAFYSLNNAPFCALPQRGAQSNYTSPPFCATTKCQSNQSPDYFYYSSQNKCSCSNSVKMILTVFPSFTVLDRNLANYISTLLSKLLPLDSSQIYIASMNSTNKKYVEIYVNLFPQIKKFSTSDLVLFENNVNFGFETSNLGLLRSISFVFTDSITEKDKFSSESLTLIIILSILLFICFTGFFLSMIFRGDNKSFCEFRSPLYNTPKRSDDPSYAIQLTTQQKTLISFKLKEIKVATNNFSTLIGRGYRSIVYKGVLPGGQVIAIKRFKGGPRQNKSEFLESTQYYSQIKHPNIVDLIGYCSEKNEQILVYEFMHLGSLADLLHGITLNDSSMEPLSWKERVDIAFEVAKGINYLHEKSLPIIHKNIKPSNVLLNEKMEVKITDIIIQISSDDNQISYANENQYVDPEYKRRGAMSLKSDVYSFGVLLLELISGIRLSGSNEVFSPQAKKKQLWELGITVDSKMGEFNVKEMQTLIGISRRCMEMEISLRPSMAEIVKDLYFIVYPFEKRDKEMVVFSHTPESTDNTIGSSSRIHSQVASNPTSFAQGRLEPNYRSVPPHEFRVDTGGFTDSIESR